MLTAVSRSLRGVARDLGGAVRTPEPATLLTELEDLRRAAAAVEDSLAASASASSHDRNQLLAALNSGADAFFGIDSEGVVRFANLAAERLFARPRDRMIARPSRR
jgi:PAS domain-containing protein